MKVLEAVNRDWPLATEVRKLQSRLWRMTRKDGSKIILVTSAVGGEGKTTTAAYLAATLAMHAGRKILAVDLDMRRPNLHNLFEVDRRPGLGNVLEGTSDLQDVIRPTSLEGLNLLLAGESKIHPSLLLDSPRLGETLDRLRPAYDLIILDSPPLVPVPDTAGLVPLSDGVLLVVMAGKTPLPHLTQARELCLGMGGKILGIVVGNAEEAAPDTYNYNYHYSYAPDSQGKKSS